MRRLNMVLLPIILIITVAILLFRTGVASTASLSPFHTSCGVWSNVASPNVGTGSNFLYGVAAISSSNVWAVGEYGNGNGSSTLVEYWNGKKWSIIRSPNVSGASENTLAGITAVAANNIWAVGSSTTSNFVQRTLIEHWDGMAWSVIVSPTQGTSDFLSGMAVVSASNIWAVGDYRTGIDPFGPYFTLIEHWDGTAWSTINSPSPGSIASDLVSAAAIPKTSKVWAAGFVQNNNAYQTLTEYYS